jgi:hypothetical protein
MKLPVFQNSVHSRTGVKIGTYALRPSVWNALFIITMWMMLTKVHGEKSDESNDLTSQDHHVKLRGLQTFSGFSSFSFVGNSLPTQFSSNGNTAPGFGPNFGFNSGGLGISNSFTALTGAGSNPPGINGFSSRPAEPTCGVAPPISPGNNFRLIVQYDQNIERQRSTRSTSRS